MLSLEQHSELKKMQKSLGMSNDMTEEEKEKWLKLKKAMWLKTIRTCSIIVASITAFCFLELLSLYLI